LPAEDIQRGVAVVIIVPIDEPTRLIDVHRDIGAVEIQHDFFWWGIVLLDKVVPE